MIEGRCHCGAVGFRLRTRPEYLVDCNCSACRRYRGLWAHAPLDEVEVRVDGPVVRYEHGDRSLAFVSCATCGGTTHWEPSGENFGYMAVNLAMAEPGEIDGLRVRRFDGADSWTYLD